MIDMGYLKTAPGLLTVVAAVLNTIAFICVVASEARASIHGGFLLAITIHGVVICLAIILCHIVQLISSKIPPYPFAVFQVAFGIFWCILHFSATTALLTKYYKIPILIATAIFSYMSALLHIAQAMLLLKAIRVTQIARQAVGFGNTISGDGVAASATTTTETVVAYTKEQETVVMDPTQTVY